MLNQMNCSICNKEFEGMGNNAAPINNGRCCDECNENMVLPARRQEGGVTFPKGTPWQDIETALGKKSPFRNTFMSPTELNGKLGGKPGLMREYIKRCEQSYNKLAKHTPGLWRAIMNKRYIIPPRRVGDYYPQIACDYLMLDFITEFTQQITGRGNDEVLNTQWVALLRALEYDRPTYYLEKELAPKIMAGKLPLDLEIDMIQWAFPSIRVYLPKEFLTIKRQGVDCSLMFMDIVRVEKEISYQMHMDFIRELIHEFGDFKARTLINAYTGMGVSGNLDFDCPEGPIAYAGTSPINQTTIAKLLSKIGSHHLESSLKSDELDTEFIDKMLTLALRILMIMSSYEIVPDPNQEQEEKPIRKPRMEGQRFITGLYDAKFIGDTITKLTESGAKARGITLPTGVHTSAHWVSGHPKRQPYGPNRELRKLIWVLPYKTQWHGV
jgi:hypothetical protein